MNERGPNDGQARSGGRPGRGTGGRAGHDLRTRKRKGASDPGKASDPVRSIALRLLMDLDSGRFPASGRMEQIENHLADSDQRRLFRALVLETLRHRSRLDHLLDSLLERRPLEDLPAPIRWILRLGAAQILLMSWIPAYAAVNASVNLARSFGHAGTAGLVNAILRRLSREGEALWESAGRLSDGSGRTAEASLGGDPAEALALAYSYPLWLVRRWVDRWGAERTEAVLAWGNELPDYWIRRNPRFSDEVRGAASETLVAGGADEAKGEADDTSDPGGGVARERNAEPAWPPAGAAADWIPDAARLPSGSRPADHPDFALGAWTIQDGSGIVVTRLAPVVRGLVLDVCAAPGTKTGALWERAEPGAQVVGLDLSAGRLRRTARGVNRLREPMARLGAEPMEVRDGESGAGCPGLHLIAADGRALPVRRDWQGALVDAPCSNLGVFRRHPDLKWRVREEEIARLASIQRALLDSAAGGVAPGGWLVYSVCTVEPEETEEQRDCFFQGHPEWRPGELPDWIPDKARLREGEILLLPGECGTDGTYAFIALREGGDTGHG